MLGRPTLLALLVIGIGVSKGPGLGAAGITSPMAGSESQSLRILTATLPDAIVGKTYRFRIQASGGREPYIWDLSTPQLPEGLALNESTGEIAGTPMSLDLYDFTVRLTDSSSPPQTVTRYFTLEVVEPLVLVPGPLPRGLLHLPYRVQLQASGGTLPLQWRIASGTLPPGLELDVASGQLAGTPAQAGEFSFTVQVTDAGKLPQTATHTFIGRVVAPLAVDWKRPPRIEAGGIYGSVQVSNDSRDDFDLTLIVVAVNEYGKAFALGYQHFALLKETVSREIPFGFSLPRGDYVVHVDAVAEVAPKNAIYRARRQHGPLRVEGAVEAPEAKPMKPRIFRLKPPPRHAEGSF